MKNFESSPLPEAEIYTPGNHHDLFGELFYEDSSEAYSAAIDRAKEMVLRFLEQTRKPFSGITPARLGAMLETVDLDTPLSGYDALLQEVKELYIDHATAFHLPNYIAHLNCPVVIPALAAEVLISAVNSSQDTWDQSAGGTLMERKLIAWTARQIGFGSQADGVFTAGGSQSNLMGLLLARDHYAGRHLGHRVKLDGNPGAASRFRVFVSEKAHFSNLKNASLLGLGEQAVVEVGTDTRFRMSPALLEEAVLREIRQGHIPIGVVATAGTTDFGNVDPLRETGRIAEKYKLWYHVDAAYGCGLLLTDRYRSLLDGIELADSVTVDYHKAFFQPVSSSACVVRDKRDLEIVRHHADYLNPREQGEDEMPAQVDKSVTQTTRRFDALKLWFTLRLMGREKLGCYIESVIGTAKQAADIIGQDPDLELLGSSDISVLVFRYAPARFKHADLCTLNRYIKKAMLQSGEVLVAGTKVNGAFYLKFTILNPLTTAGAVQRILTIIKTHGLAYEQ